MPAELACRSASTRRCRRCRRRTARWPAARRQTAGAVNRSAARRGRHRLTSSWPRCGAVPRWPRQSSSRICRPCRPARRGRRPAAPATWTPGRRRSRPVLGVRRRVVAEECVTRRDRVRAPRRPSWSARPSARCRWRRRCSPVDGIDHRAGASPDRRVALAGTTGSISSWRSLQSEFQTCSRRAGRWRRASRRAPDRAARRRCSRRSRRSRGRGRSSASDAIFSRRGQPGDRRAPDHAAVRDGELLDVAVRRRGVDRARGPGRPPAWRW